MDTKKSPFARMGKEMEVVLWGTRGSGSVTLPDQSPTYGSNTTSIEIRSQCIPPETVFLLDAGKGAAACNFEYMRHGVSPKQIFLLQTHYHLDHITGALLMPWWYNKKIEKYVFGPLTRSGKGPENVFGRLMDEDFWPIPWDAVSSAFRTHSMKFPAAEVIIVHPKGGICKIPLSEYENALKKGSQLSMSGKKYEHDEMLVIRMWQTSHKEHTVSYRIEERPTGCIFTLMTDHECTAAIPLDMIEHIRGSHTLVIDGQYTTEMYQTLTGGWGHGTPPYAVQVAAKAEIKNVVLTHHDPMSRNDFLERSILREAHETAAQIAGISLEEYLASPWMNVSLARDGQILRLVH